MSAEYSDEELIARVILHQILYGQQSHVFKGWTGKECREVALDFADAIAATLRARAGV
jgi:hypothetical protein